MRLPILTWPMNTLKTAVQDRRNEKYRPGNTDKRKTLRSVEHGYYMDFYILAEQRVDANTAGKKLRYIFIYHENLKSKALMLISKQTAIIIQSLLAFLLFIAIAAIFK